MTDEIDTNLPEQIWAYQENAQWKERGWSPEPITYGGAQEYVRADLYDAERQRAERVEEEKKIYESGWLEAEGIISDLQERVERAEAERDRLHSMMRSIILILLDADERGQGVAWQNAMDMAQHAIERGLEE